MSNGTALGQVSLLKILQRLLGGSSSSSTGTAISRSLYAVLGRPSLLPTVDALHLEGSVNQGMGAVIFSAGLTQTRSVPADE